MAEMQKRNSLPWHVDTPPIRRWYEDMLRSGKQAEAARRVELWDQWVQEDGVVRHHVAGPVGWITLCYPSKGNAFVPPMYRMLEAAIEEMAYNEDVWAIVLTGAGQTFSTGGHVSPDGFYAGLDAGGEATTAEPMRRTFTEMFQRVQRRLWEVEKPTVAMLNGPVMAEAVDLALAADLRTASTKAEIRFSFGRTGNTAYTGSNWMLPRYVGMAKAKEILLLSRNLTASECLDLGLVSYVAEPQSLLNVTETLVERLTSLPPITLRLIKKELHLGCSVDTLQTSLDMTAAIEPIVQFTQDHMDAEQAVIEKRPPVVRGQ